MLASSLTLSPRLIVCPENIVQILGESNYSRIIMNDGQNIMVSQTLSMIQQKLPSEFIRIHKSHLINVRYLAQILRRQKLFVLTNGFRVPVSRRRAAGIQANLLQSTDSPTLGIPGFSKKAYLSTPLPPTL
ncbi:LytR/AlgR family response regulator transcription factor [Runella sp.]|uniref:LytR/AlgR family response regulator transcription factor n=1 Tax=Runella sp. TaxID=1960881 RepID=UPI003D14A0B7